MRRTDGRSMLSACQSPDAESHSPASEEAILRLHQASRGSVSGSSGTHRNRSCAGGHRRLTPAHSRPADPLPPPSYGTGRRDLRTDEVQDDATIGDGVRYGRTEADLDREAPAGIEPRRAALTVECAAR